MLIIDFNHYGNKKRFLGDLIQVVFHRALASSVGVKDGTLTSRDVTVWCIPKDFWEQLLTCLAHPKEHFKTSLNEYWEGCAGGGGGGGGGEWMVGKVTSRTKLIPGVWSLVKKAC